VPRLSLWKEGLHTNDFKFMDRRMSEMFTVGGTGILVHKYLGIHEQNLTKSTTTTQSNVSSNLGIANTADIALGMYVAGNAITTGTKVIAKTANTVTLSANTTSVISSNTTVKFYKDATEPSYMNQSAQNIQDLFFLENRDRKYDTSVYSMRGVYSVQDATFDLTQFGLFLQAGTLYIVFHINDMIDIIGRKLMAGDVLELMHLKDYNPLDDTLPVALKRYFVISDCNNAAEGFSSTWWPHLWRCKINPLTDSQEYKDILNTIKVDEDIPGSGTGNITLGSVSSIIQKYQDINDAIIREAETNVPFSGYDTSYLYVKPATSDELYPTDPVGLTADSNLTADGNTITAGSGIDSPDALIKGYLTSAGGTVNGLPVVVGIAFPTNPLNGDLCLRTDYSPNRLFRYDGRRWVKMEDNVRTSLTPGPDNNTLRSNFVNDDSTFTNNRGNVAVRQSLSKALRPEADN
jgi:hypothetical protein